MFIRLEVTKWEEVPEDVLAVAELTGEEPEQGRQPGALEVFVAPDLLATVVGNKEGFTEVNLMDGQTFEVQKPVQEVVKDIYAQVLAWEMHLESVRKNYPSVAGSAMDLVGGRPLTWSDR